MRLAALRDAPSAFGMTLAEASAETDAQWRERAARVPCAYVLAFDASEAVGLAAGVLTAGGEYHLMAMWVRPQWRGKGIAAALVGAAQMGAIEFHIWGSRNRALDLPDRMVFDLDPGEGVEWAQVVEGATLVRGLLDELGLKSLLKTSGGKGLHVVVPLARREGWDVVKDFSEAVVQHLAEHAAQRFVARSGPKNRVGRIFVDYLRNGRGATTVAAYSARVRPGLGVSLPVGWDELPTLQNPHATVANALPLLAASAAAWAGWERVRQPLGPAMKRLGFKPAAV